MPTEIITEAPVASEQDIKSIQQAFTGIFNEAVEILEQAGLKVEPKSDKNREDGGLAKLATIINDDGKERHLYGYCEPRDAAMGLGHYFRICVLSSPVASYLDVTKLEDGKLVFGSNDPMQSDQHYSHFQAKLDAFSKSFKASLG